MIRYAIGLLYQKGIFKKVTPVVSGLYLYFEGTVRSLSYHSHWNLVDIFILLLRVVYQKLQSCSPY